eukprot:3021768-Prorocentrum_lima.AAC.1
MTSSLVGSEMCIRDRGRDDKVRAPLDPSTSPSPSQGQPANPRGKTSPKAVSYTHLTLPTICSV